MTIGGIGLMDRIVLVVMVRSSKIGRDTAEVCVTCGVMAVLNFLNVTMS